jgi:hypothetical protein
MATSEIEKLERRYAENPHGLTFAPLAEVHRKNGDVARALELLTAGLELHPNYIPASIVLGRCHQDLGDLPSAEAAFAHVLRLDDENVIALKCLADINERQERLGEAGAWLRRLVSVDRSNDEAKEQLRRIETARQGDQGQGDKGSAAEAAAPAPVLEMIDLTPEPVAESREPASSPADLLPVDIAAMVLKRSAAEQPPSHEAASSDEEPADGTPPPSAAVSQHEERTDATEPEVAGAAPVSEPVQASSPRMAEEPAAEEEPVQPLPGLISAEFQPPLESTGGLGVETSEEVVLEVSGDSEFRVPDASEDLKSLAARLNRPPFTAPRERQEEAAPAVEPRRSTELEFLVTEARAEPETARERQTARPPSYVAADTKGQSVGAFFQALVAARPPSAPRAGGGFSSRGETDAPGLPAHDGASPGSVPREESRAVPPAVATGEQRADPAVSFDDFFDSEGDESNARRHGSSEPGKDDLDQFQSWLQNLKR